MALLEHFICKSCCKPIILNEAIKAHKKGLCSKNCKDAAFKFNKKKRTHDIKVELSFYKSEAWLRLRFKVVAHYGKICMACGETKGRFHVDHIIPRSVDRSLELDFNNLQMLCEPCNIGKSNLDKTDFRPKNATKP